MKAELPFCDLLVICDTIFIYNLNYIYVVLKITLRLNMAPFVSAAQWVCIVYFKINHNLLLD